MLDLARRIDKGARSAAARAERAKLVKQLRDLMLESVTTPEDLDALARVRRASGRHAVALAWGAWEQTSGMTAAMSDADLRRIARSGMPALKVAEGLTLFDAGSAGHPAASSATP